MMNLWAFTGNLGKDCETRFTPKGDAVTSFSVGVASGYGDKATTTWANCNLWGKQAESLAPYLTKGQKVAITGEVALTNYTTKEGVEKQTLNVRVGTVTLVGSKGDANIQPAKNNATKAQDEAPRGDLSDIDDDIPFMNPYKFNWRVV